MNKLALFRFEASQSIGAGHAMRSCVIADALKEHDWNCRIATTKSTYDFLPQLVRFDRIDPNIFNKDNHCDLLIIDNYDIGQTHEQDFRSIAKKIYIC